MRLDPLDLALDGLATHRLTRLVVEDQITEPLRELVWKKFDPEETKVGYFLTCPWCVSIWTGAAVVLLRAALPDRWDKAAQVLAFSSFTGLVAKQF